MSTTQNLIKWFRHSSPYINAHRGKTVVLMICGEALAHPNFTNIIHDISLLNSLGVKLVLVYGIRPQIDQRLSKAGLARRFHNLRRITDRKTLPSAIEAAGSQRIKIESLLSMGLSNSPMHGSKIRVCSGNFVCAHPVGVMDGIDFQYTGRVRRIDADAINRHLADNTIVLLQPLGYSPTGEIFNLSYEDVASSTAAALSADKLIVFSSGKGIIDSEGKLQRELTLKQARRFMEQDGLEDEILRQLHAVCNAESSGVKRSHIISYVNDGALIEELFTRDGVGTMISDDGYDQVRTAGINDIGGIIELIKPLEREGVLAHRSRELLESEIGQFTIDERDGTIIGCAALYPFMEEGLAELACLAVKSDYRKLGRGDSLLASIEKQALDLGINRLFVLTTQTAHWFRERGFSEVGISELPEKKQHLYNLQRNSKVFMKNLVPTERITASRAR